MLAFTTEGRGAPLVLIHGWGVSYDIWRTLAPLLQPYFTLIKVELPGIGNSPPAPAGVPYYTACANGIAAVVRHLGYERVSVLSYSTGTRAAEAFWLGYPQMIERMAFLCPVYPAGVRAAYMQVVDFLDQRAPRWGNWMLRGWRLHAMVRLLGFNGRGGVYLYDWLDEIREQPVESLKTTLRDIPSSKRHMAGLPTPHTLFVWGQYDLVQPRLRRVLPQDRVLPSAHNAPVFHARQIAREIIPFLLKQTDMLEPATTLHMPRRPAFFLMPRRLRLSAQRRRLYEQSRTRRRGRERWIN